MPGTRLNRPVPKNKLPLPWFLKTLSREGEEKTRRRTGLPGVVSWDWKVGSQVGWSGVKWMEWGEWGMGNGWGRFLRVVRVGFSCSLQSLHLQGRAGDATIAVDPLTVAY